MDFTEYKKLIADLPYGKRLNVAVYVLAEGLDEHARVLASFIAEVRAKTGISSDYNILKFFLSEFKVSFLAYPTFMDDPHPALQESITVNLATGKVRHFSYARSKNAPILHRKETFLPVEHPQRAVFAALTKEEEALGLYAKPRTIGFKNNWEVLLAQKGIAFAGHTIVHQTVAEAAEQETSVARHKTAITRYAFSKPVQLTIENGLLRDGESFFDYGCGLGDDVRGLVSNGFDAQGWDPVHSPDVSLRKADVVNLGFVINVIEDPAERVEVIHKAYGLSKKLLVISSLLTNNITAKNLRPYKDGYLTSRNTFQRYYEQDELQNFIEHALDTSAIAAGPGVFFVFKEPKDLQQYLADKNTRKINWEALSLKLYPNKRARQKILLEETYQQHRALVNGFWEKMIALGRLPLASEYPGYAEVCELLGSAQKAQELFIEKFGVETLKAAHQQRRDDLLVYLALSNFKKRAKMTNLPPSLQADIKTFFGSYRAAQLEGLQGLFVIGNSDQLTEIASQSAVGFFDHKALYVTPAEVEQLHPVLRIYVGCAELYYGPFNEARLIKIHKRSGKVTGLFPLEDAVGYERVKVDLRRQRISQYRHQEEDLDAYISHLREEPS